MNYYFVPSLQCLATNKIATVLWSQAPLVKFNKIDGNRSLRSCKNIDGWQELEQEIIDKVWLLPLPARLKDKTSCVVRPIGLQILKWKVGTERYCGFQFCIENFLNEFCWTSQGTVHKKKTAEALVTNCTLTDIERFRLASLYCIENCTLPRNSCEQINCDPAGPDGFIAYWAHSITGRVAVLEEMTRYTQHTSKSSDQCAFEWAVIIGNKEMAEYYFHWLTPREKEASLSNVIFALEPCFADYDFYRFLLLQMNEQQQSELLESYAGDVAESLLNWPWQDFFLDMTKHMRVFLNRCDYFSLLSKIVDNIEDGSRDYDYRGLFRKLWMQIPAECKRLTLRDCRDGLLLRLFQVSDVETVSLLLKDLTTEEKETVIFERYNGIHTCAVLAENDQWDSLKLLLGECLSSRDKMMQFKGVCEQSEYFGDAFFQCIDELVEERSKKRGADEADYPLSKRLCISSNE